MLKSIQWKMVIIYLLLVLLAMEVIGVYLLRSLESYHLENLSSYLDGQAQLISSFIERYLTPTEDKDHIDDLLSQFENQIGMEILELSVLDSKGVVIASTQSDSPKLGTRILASEVTRAVMGEKGEDIRIDPVTNKRFKYLAFPIRSGSQVVGLLYMVVSLENIYATLQEIKTILMMATMLALVVTVVLGFALAKTITSPILDVTSKAAGLAQGNFDQKIEVKSNDEIGQLAEMFNYLTLRLKETLGEISNEKGKIEAILTYMADGVIAMNITGEIIHINPAAARLLNIDQLATGKHFNDVLGNHLPEIYIKDIQGDIQDEREIDIKLGGSVLKAHIAHFKNEKGETAGVVVVIRDVTEQERLDNIRKEFVANVSHELRTPLTTIKSYVETLLSGAMSDNDVAERFLQVVNNESERMARLVSDLLQLSRLDYQRTRWDKKPMDLGHVVKDVVSKLDVSFKQKDMTVKLQVPSAMPKILADRDRLEQVVLNIVGNAVKYTPEHGLIKISLNESAGRLVLRVKDNGIGIPKADLPRIFERFYRVDKARSRELGGTGLGLAIAKEIIEAHNGTIQIESEYGKGTLVSLTLPVLENTQTA
jgi:two-component system sensor histidine kinase VicK